MIFIVMPVIMLMNYTKEVNYCPEINISMPKVLRHACVVNTTVLSTDPHLESTLNNFANSSFSDHTVNTRTTSTATLQTDHNAATSRSTQATVCTGPPSSYAYIGRCDQSCDYCGVRF